MNIPYYHPNLCYNLSAIEETALELAELLSDRENALKRAYPSGNFPELPPYSQNEALGDAINAFWESYYGCDTF